MACCRGGVVKLTKASILPPTNECQKSKTVIQATVQFPKKQYNSEDSLDIEDVKHFQTRVVKLREKLTEANTNICTLKAFVNQTVGQVTNGVEAKNSKEMINELKDLLVSLEEILDHNEIITQRGVECMQIIEKFDNFNCTCGPASPSVESIRRKLECVCKEKEIIDQEIQKEKDEILQAKRSKSTEVDINPSASSNVATGIQHCCYPPECKPKILQTEQKYKVTEGTNPTMLNSFSKGQNVRMKCHCKTRNDI